MTDACSETATRPAVVAHVLCSFGVGGAETVALELAREQRARGNQVMAVSLGAAPHGPLQREFQQSGIQTHCVRKRSGVDLTLVPRLLALFRKQRVQVVHTHNQQPLIYAAPAGKLARAVVLHTKHGDPLGGTRLRLLRRAGAAFCDSFIAVSEATAQAARQGREVAAEKLSVIPNGIDVDRFRPCPAARVALRAELGIPADAWVMGTVGRLVEVKDHALLLRGAAPLLREGLSWLVIVGSGPEEQRLRELTRTLGISSHVLFTGLRRDVDRLLASFDVFALTSRSEGLPLVLLEAMASGLPVVATDVGGVPGVVEDGKTGRLVSPGDDAGLEVALRALAADRDATIRMGQHARQEAEARYSLAGMAKRHMELAASLLPQQVIM